MFLHSHVTNHADCWGGGDDDFGVIMVCHLNKAEHDTTHYTSEKASLEGGNSASAVTGAIHRVIYPSHLN